jgi:hypothetical protein
MSATVRQYERVSTLLGKLSPRLLRGTIEQEGLREGRAWYGGPQVRPEMHTALAVLATSKLGGNVFLGSAGRGTGIQEFPTISFRRAPFRTRNRWYRKESQNSKRGDVLDGLQLMLFAGPRAVAFRSQMHGSHVRHPDVMWRSGACECIDADQKPQQPLVFGTSPMRTRRLTPI